MQPRFCIFLLRHTIFWYTDYAHDNRIYHQPDFYHNRPGGPGRDIFYNTPKLAIDGRNT